MTPNIMLSVIHAECRVFVYVKLSVIAVLHGAMTVIVLALSRTIKLKTK
jgi:hypothetical protein